MNNPQSQSFTIVPAAPDHAAGIAAITRPAFAARYGTGDAEVAIIAGLRADGDVVVEFAALEDGGVVGHAMFSRATADPRPCRVAALGPVVARIDRQRMGIGDSLIRAGLSACAERGVDAVIVLGDPRYYGRFGFSALRAAGIACVYAGPDFQALELRAGALDGVKSLAYARAFQLPGS